MSRNTQGALARRNNVVSCALRRQGVIIQTKDLESQDARQNFYDLAQISFSQRRSG